MELAGTETTNSRQFTTQGTDRSPSATETFDQPQHEEVEENVEQQVPEGVVVDEGYEGQRDIQLTITIAIMIDYEWWLSIGLTTPNEFLPL